MTKRPEPTIGGVPFDGRVARQKGFAIFDNPFPAVEGGEEWEAEWNNLEPEPWERSLSQCDCCGELQYDCEDVVAYGLDTHACPACRSERDQ